MRGAEVTKVVMEVGHAPEKKVLVGVRRTTIQERKGRNNPDMGARIRCPGR
jgi:hypothetical protein